MPASSAFSIGIGKRRSARLSLSVRGMLSSELGIQFVELIDLSQTGARLALSSSRSFSAGRLEWLGFAANGQVVWHAKRSCGLEFDEAVPVEWVTATRAKAGAAVRA